MTQSVTALLLLLGLWAVHRPPDLAIAHYGTFSCPAHASDSWPWTEVTFFPGDLFSARDATGACESTFGYGNYRQINDTLTLMRIHAWGTGGCRYELTEDLIVPEKRFLVRSRDSVSFEIRPIGVADASASDWIRLWKYGSRQDAGIRK